MDFNDIKEALLEEKAKIEAEKEFKATVRKVYSRPKNYLTQQVKKAGKQAPGSLECFKEENMYYSKKETQAYLDGSSYMETYNAMKEHDDWN